MKPHFVRLRRTSKGGRVLVTGASGFIGRQSLPILLEREYEVHAVSLKTETETAHVQWHHVDLLNADARKKLFDEIQPTHILHFAWIATPGIYWTSPLNEEWKHATLDLLELSKANGVERFVGTGTCAEYDWSNGHCDERATPLVPVTPYGKAKAETDQAVIHTTDISTAWGRIFFLYGPHEHPKRLVPSVILSLLKNEPAKCTHGNQVRDFLHVRDIASAFVALLERDVTGPVNIASGIPVTLKQVVTTIGNQLGKSDLIEVGAIEAPVNDPPKLTAAVERLQREVGWKPGFSLKEGIEDAIGWWKTQL